PLAIAFTQPNIISVGSLVGEIDKNNLFIGHAGSRANAGSRNFAAGNGILRMYARNATGKLVSAGMISQRSEHLRRIWAIALDDEMTVHQLLQAEYYHPVVEEMIQSALQDIARRMKPSPYPLGLRAL